VAQHLLVTNDFPPKTGGIQVYLDELWRRLEPGRAVVLTASSHPDAASFDANSSLKIERVSTKTLFWPSRKTKRAIEDAIARHDPKIVLLDPAWPLGLVGPFLSRPFGVILHGAEVTIPARIPVIASSLRFVLRRAKVAICAGPYPEFEARRCARHQMPPVIQIPPGVDCERFVPIGDTSRAELRRRFDIDDDALVVASYSRLVPRKGMDVLIRASAQLRQRFPKLLVTIGGAGRDRARLEKLAQRLDAPVRFLGRVSDDDLPNWLAASDLMVMDCRSRWAGFEQEGFGIVFLEAAACALAQVAGRSGGSHDAVLDGRTGIIVNNPRSTDDLASSMASLLDDRALRERLGQAARANAEAVFDWRQLAGNLATQLAKFDGSPV
jgi:phosphatidylinositol alpha-1,6-mannosyltransferase